MSLKHTYRNKIPFETLVKSHWLAKIMDFKPGISLPTYSHIDQIYYFDKDDSVFSRRLVENFAHLYSLEAVTEKFTPQSIENARMIYMPHVELTSLDKEKLNYNYARTLAEDPKTLTFFSPNYDEHLISSWPSENFL